MKKKVLFIGPWEFAPHVGFKNVRVIYPSFLEPLNGCEFHLLHGKPKLPDYTKELTDRYGMIFHRINSRHNGDWIRQASKLVRELDIDVLTNVFFGFYFGYIAVKTAEATQRKAVVRFAANEIYVRKCAGEYGGFNGKIRFLKDIYMQKITVKLAHKIIAMSPWEEKRLKRLASPREKVEWCMRGIDVNDYAPTFVREKRPACNFIYVGRKVKEKGYQLIENVARHLEETHPGLKFYFAGTFDKKNDGNRIYLGYCSPKKIQDLYIKMDALILPSQSEGFPNVVVEAMSMGLPVIISRQYHEEYFTHKKNALLIDLNEEALKTIILEIHHNKRLCSNLSKEARAFAVREFDSKKWGINYRRLILGEI